MKKIFVLLILSVFSQLYGAVLEIDVPEPVFQKSGDEVIPLIDGYILDGTGEKIILPYKSFTFSSKIRKVEIVEKREISTPAPLKKGDPIYRLGDMVRVQPVAYIDTLLPSLENFHFNKKPTFRRGQKEYSMTLYPLIPLAEDKVAYISKIKVHFESEVIPLSPTYGRDSMLILTSNDFVLKSKELSKFINVKREQGFKINVATESDYNAGDLTGYERALAIRSWLYSIYKEYYFLLIIADPSPGGRDVPMIIARPNRGEVESNYEETATDVFYGELSEDIDSNRNGIPGEREDNIKLAFELVVGRIPFYGGRIEDADKILARTTRYIREKPSLAQYRRKLLFPTSIAYYGQQDGQLFMPKMDGAYVAKYIENNYLDDSFSTKILVENEGADPSEYAGEEEGLSYKSMLNSWNDHYGIIYWMGHGMPMYTVRTIWLGDRKGVGYPTSWDMKSETFVDSDMTIKFEDHTSPFVFQGSCLNGKVENPRNLGFYSLLNSAVGVVTSSQVAYGSIRKDYSLSSQDLFAYGTIFVEALVKNRFPAMVIQQKKESWSNSSVLLTMKYAVNYLGDPSLHLNSVQCENDSQCDDGLFCNGKEKCVEGFCEVQFNALPCESDTGNTCSVRICDEKTKSCKETDRMDGSYCGEAKSLCNQGMKCLKGECVDWGFKDCSEMDSECSIGYCNESNGLCEIEMINENGGCDDGLFCTENGKCNQGVCIGKIKELPENKPCLKVVCDNTIEDFNYLIDNSQNWEKCRRSDGREGHCYYGICQAGKDENIDNNSGCSVTVL